VSQDPLTLGEIIRRQRELNALSMRRFADMVGISNPYLSQIERGLREPSEQVLDAIARSLETSTDALYEQAGMADDDEVAGESATLAAIESDPALTPRQRQALTQVYEAFTAQNGQPKRRRRRRKAADPGPEPGPAA
jgi:transcriptional regulator with XRE-family HTH domain